MSETSWSFREFTLDRASFLLRRGDVPVKLDPKPLELLFLLAERAGNVVSHDDALRRVWGEDVFLDGESALYTAIKKIRQALGDPTLVQTVSGRGYRLRIDTEHPASPLLAPRQQQHLAILPLINLSGDPAEDYFSDGLTEELITTVARLFGDNVGVIARTSVMRFKSLSLPIPQIAQDLGADYLIEGSVRRDGQRVRIAVQLLRASDGICIWSETFDRAIDDIFALQAEIALATAAAIRIRLSTSVATETPVTIDPVIHDRYLRARHLWVQRTRPTIHAAIKHFREILALAPTFAPAYAGLSCCYALLPITSNQRPHDCFPQAHSLAMQAIALDPTQAEAHITLGLVEFWYRRNWSAALRRFRQASRLNPSDSQPLMFLAHVHSILGQHELALATIAAALQLDPLSAIVSTHQGHFLYNAGRFRAAQSSLTRVLEMNPQFWIAHLMHGKALASDGKPARAIQAFKQAQQFGMGNTEAMSFRAYTLSKSGKQTRASETVAELDSMHATQPVPPLHRALARLGNADLQPSLDLLEEGFAECDVRLVFLGVESRWRDLGDSAYASLLARAGLQPGGAIHHSA